MTKIEKAIKTRIAETQAERRRVNEQAAQEYLAHGNTRRFRRLWRQVAALEIEKERLEVLVGTHQEPPQVGFTAEFPPCPTDDDAPPDTDDDDETFDDDEGEFWRNEIYCTQRGEQL